MNRAFRYASFAAALPLLLASAAQSAAVKHPRVWHKPVMNAGIGVAMDEARLITFRRPASTVFVGNPMIADVNIVDSRHVFVLGKTFGVTNLIALGTDGSQIENSQVTVVNHTAAITVNRGSDQFNYSCSRLHCETQPRPGDPKTAYFDNTEQAVAEHEDLGTKNAEPPSNQTAQTPVD